MIIFSLHMASINNNLEIVQKLISCGADVNIKDKVNWNFNFNLNLLYVSSNEIIRVLIDLKQGRTAAHWASFKGHDEILSCLLKAGIEPDERDEDGKTGKFIHYLNIFSNISYSFPYFHTFHIQ